MINISKPITNTKDVFENLGMEKSTLTEAQTTFLNEKGYLIFHQPNLYVKI